MSQALITGGAGFIGSHLADALLEKGWAVTVVDDLSTGLRQNVAPSVIFRRAKAGGTECCQNFTHIFHLAATVGVERVTDRPFQTLTDGFLAGEMAVIAQSLKAKFFYASSSEVYDLQPDPSPKWNYAISKRMGEALVREKCPNAVIGRFFNVVGPRQRADFGMVLPRFVKAARAGCPLPLVGDGSQSRTLLHVADAVAGILATLEGPPGVYDIGSPDPPWTIRALGEHVGEILGCPITFESKPAREHDVLRRPTPNVAPLRALGWIATHTIAEAIRGLACE